MAGVLAGGDGAVLSHRSAAALWGLPAPDPPFVEITSTQSTRSVAWLRRHCGQPAGDEATCQEGIPVTTVSRTLLDLATCASPDNFERALREAEFLRLPQFPPLAELLSRHAGRRGTRLVRNTLERLSHLPGGDTRSMLEDRFLRLAEKVGLPLPETNVTIRVDGRRYDADCIWRQARVILELDGRQAHATRTAFERDRERDRRLQAAGWTVIRATWQQVTEASALVRDLRQLLKAREAA